MRSATTANPWLTVTDFVTVVQRIGEDTIATVVRLERKYHRYIKSAFHVAMGCKTTQRAPK